MIDLKQLTEIHPIYCYPKGDTVSFEAIEKEIRKIADEFGIPIIIDTDKINSGSIIAPVIEDCLIIYHPEHRSDYRNFVIRISREGDTAFIGKFSLGDAGHDEEKKYFKVLLAVFEFLKC